MLCPIYYIMEADTLLLDQPLLVFNMFNEKSPTSKRSVGGRGSFLINFCLLYTSRTVRIQEKLKNLRQPKLQLWNTFYNEPIN
jgi:hypothetical protein